MLLALLQTTYLSEKCLDTANDQQVHRNLMSYCKIYATVLITWRQVMKDGASQISACVSICSQCIRDKKRLHQCEASLELRHVDHNAVS